MFPVISHFPTIINCFSFLNRINFVPYPNCLIAFPCHTSHQRAYRYTNYEKKRPPKRNPPWKINHRWCQIRRQQSTTSTPEEKNEKLIIINKQNMMNKNMNKKNDCHILFVCNYFHTTEAPSSISSNGGLCVCVFVWIKWQSAQQMATADGKFRYWI